MSLQIHRAERADHLVAALGDLLAEGVVKPVLRAVRAVVADELGLDLRVGLVPVSDLHARGAGLAVLKHAASEHYWQAMFSGGGLLVAERLVKDPATAARILCLALILAGVAGLKMAS